MNRKQFLKTCGYGCIAGGSILTLLQGCTSSKILTREIIGSDIIVPVSDFLLQHENKGTFKKYVIVHNTLLRFPICVYRFGALDYTALLMECTHQGSELQVFGDKLQCASHGSEFSNKGIVETGPAYLDLRKFPVVIENDLLKISLRK